jgi:hypothetical protein
MSHLFTRLAVVKVYWLRLASYQHVLPPS